MVTGLILAASLRISGREADLRPRRPGHPPQHRPHPVPARHLGRDPRRVPVGVVVAAVDPHPRRRGDHPPRRRGAAAPGAQHRRLARRTGHPGPGPDRAAPLAAPPPRRAGHRRAHRGRPVPARGDHGGDGARPAPGAAPAGRPPPAAARPPSGPGGSAWPPTCSSPSPPSPGWRPRSSPPGSALAYLLEAAPVGPRRPAAAPLPHGGAGRRARAGVGPAPGRLRPGEQGDGPGLAAELGGRQERQPQPVRPDPRAAGGDGAPDGRPGALAGGGAAAWSWPSWGGAPDAPGPSRPPRWRWPAPSTSPWPRSAGTSATSSTSSASPSTSGSGPRPTSPGRCWPRRPRLAPLLVLVLLLFTSVKVSLTVEAPRAVADTYQQRYQAAVFLDRYYDGEAGGHRRAGLHQPAPRRPHHRHHRPGRLRGAGGPQAASAPASSARSSTPSWPGTEASGWPRSTPPPCCSTRPTSWILVGTWTLAREEFTAFDREFQFWATVPEEVAPAHRAPARVPARDARRRGAGDPTTWPGCGPTG